MSITDRRVDTEDTFGVVDVVGVSSDGFPDVEVVVAVGLTADGSPTFLLEVVQVLLTSIFSVAVDWKLGSHL